MEKSNDLRILLPERQDADIALDAFIKSGDDISIQEIDHILGNVGSLVSDVESEAVIKSMVLKDEKEILPDQNDQIDNPVVTPASSVIDELEWLDEPKSSSNNTENDNAFNILDDGSNTEPYAGELEFLDEVDFEVPKNDEKVFDILNDGRDIKPYEGDLTFLDSDQTNQESTQYTDESVRLKKLSDARDELAALSVMLRGKNSSKTNAKLHRKFESAKQKYTKLYEDESKLAILDLRINGSSEEEINQLSAFGIKDESDAFKESESKAYETINPVVGRIAKRWAKSGIVQKVLISGGIGFAATTVVPAALVVGGVSGAFLGVSAVSIKAAKTIGMYKLNKNGKRIREFDKKANQDKAYAGQFTSRSIEDKEETIDQIDYLSSAVSRAMSSSIDLRIEHDQRENKKQLAIILGTVAAGAALGLLAHNIFDKHSSGSTNGNANGGSNGPESSANPTPKPPTNNWHQGPDSGKGVTKPGVPTPGNNHVGSGRTLSGIPGNTVETPVDAQPIPDFGLNRMSWEVAHDFAPGQESAFMQRGMDMFNQTHGTNFALTSHSGSTWIMDGGYAVNPAQMEEMNRMMVLAFAEQLEEVA